VITKTDQKKQAKEITALIGKVSETVDAVDIALFGRMVAQAAELNIEAAASFAHAISTHKVANEVEFFTALDDCATEPGAAHMGSLEFNSATYYRYVSLDLGQLARTLSSQSLPEAVEAFSKALFLAVPVARQSTQSGASPWGFAKVLVRRGQRLQVPFETAVKAENGGFLEPSIEALTRYLSRQEKLHGSLFGKIAEYTYGQDDAFSIDDLISVLKRHSSEFLLEGANA
jgi:CRISPR system Cascade subunit CasC